MSSNLIDLSDRRAALANLPHKTHDGGGGDDGVDDMIRRVTALEGKTDGLVKDVAELKGMLSSMPTTFQMASWMVGIAVALAAIVFTVQLQISAKVDALPGQINESVRESNRAFADALNASVQVLRQQPPQVIVVPPQAAPQK